MTPPSVHVIGYGSMGRRHASNLRKLGATVLVWDAEVGRQQDARHDEFEVKLPVYQPGEVNVPFVVATPAHTHGEWIQRLRRYTSDPHLFVEKPLTTKRECKDVDCHNVWVGYNLRFHPAVRMLKTRDRERPSCAVFRIHCNKASWPGSGYADMLLEASHELDLALHLFGPGSVRMAAGSGDLWTVAIAHDSGDSSFVILDGTFRNGYERRIEISSRLDYSSLAYGDAFLGGYWRLESTFHGTMRGATSYEELYFAEMSAWLGDKKGLATGLDANQVIAWCDDARAYAAGKAAITLNP